MKTQRKNTISNLESPEISFGQVNSFPYSNSFMKEKLRQQNTEIESGTNRNPRVPFGLFHDDIDIQHAKNAPSEGDPQIEKDKMLVKLKRTEDNPLKVQKDLKSELPLFSTQNTSKKKMPNGDWLPVRKQIGTIENPIIENQLVPEDIFLQNKPKSSDIIQGGIGSCYFLAAVNSVVDQDPNQIRNMMKINGDNVSVNFHYFDQNAAIGSQWKPTTIQIDTTVAQFSYGSENHMLGSTFRVSEKSKYAKWYGEVDKNTLSIHKDEYYEGAIWVALMEKAYAVFAEKHGQYGGYDQDLANFQDMNTSGYAIIEGGYDVHIYNLIYGNRMKEGGHVGFEYDPKSNDAVDINMIQLLLLDEGVGVDKNDDFHVTTLLSPDSSISRLRSQLDHFLNLNSVDNFPSSFLNTLDSIANKIDKYQALMNNAGIQSAESLQQQIIRIVRKVIQPQRWPTTKNPNDLDEITRLQDLLLIVSQLGDDSGGGQRFTYAWHSYTVMDSTLRDSKNKILTPNLKNLKKNLPKIDPQNSTVTIRNPHGANVEDRMGVGTPDNDGLMQMTLEEFNRVFELLKYGVTTKK